MTKTIMNTNVRITETNAVSQNVSQAFTPERLRILVQDCHINFLFGAGTCAPFLSILGNIETVLTELSDSDSASQQARAAVQAYFLEESILPNLELLEGKKDEAVNSSSHGHVSSQL